MKRHAFTLFEMVMVILILGILATIAVPKYLTQTEITNDQALKITLAEVRDAIDRYAAEHDRELPSFGDEAGFKNKIEPYLRGDFPEVTVGPTAGTGDATKIKISDTGAEIHGEGDPDKGWHYNKQTGQFVINWDKATVFDPSVDYDEL